MSDAPNKAIRVVATPRNKAGEPGIIRRFFRRTFDLLIERPIEAASDLLTQWLRNREAALKTEEAKEKLAQTALGRGAEKLTQEDVNVVNTQVEVELRRQSQEPRPSRSVEEIRADLRALVKELRMAGGEIELRLPKSGRSEQEPQQQGDESESS